MIWAGGRVLPDEALSIPVADRTFEHGLGLFETARTWDGRPLLLNAHRDRMLRSSQELGFPIDPTSFPDAGAVADLLDAERHTGDRMLRITASGGVPNGAGPVVWMRSAPLPPPPPRDGFVVALATWMIAAQDPTARHKMLNYWTRRVAYEKAKAAGYDEVLAMTPGWVYWEGSRTNLFAVKDDCLLVPSLGGPIVPGIMRQLVLDLATELPWTVREVQGIEGRDLGRSDELFLTNAVRGIVPVGKGEGRTWPAPGPWTRRLQLLLEERLTTMGRTS